MITSVPFDDIGVSHIEALLARQVPENQTLEYKQALPFDDTGKHELLKDVTAMANAAGGTIVYGLREGEGELASIPVEITPLEVSEYRGEAIDQLLSDGVQERIMGVRQRSFGYPGGQLHVIRVPQSPLAPHMITKPTTKPRFYQRVNLVNAPMNVQQIKELVARNEGAVARATAIIDQRAAYWRTTWPEKPAPGLIVRSSEAGHALLHVLPLYPPVGGLDLADEALRTRFGDIPPFYSDVPTTQHRMSLLGYSTVEAVFTPAHPERSVTLLRSGGLEFHAAGIATLANGQIFVDVWDLEMAVLRSLDAVAAFAAWGFAIQPAVVSLRLLALENVPFRSPHYIMQPHRVLLDGEASIDPVVIHDWATNRHAVARRLFDVVWQAFGWNACDHYAADGMRKSYASSQGRIPR